MPENASVFQRNQIAVETTSGVAPTTGYKRLLSLSVEPSPAVEVDVFRPLGNKFATVSSLGKEWAKGKLSGTPTYTELHYALANIFGHNGTPTTVTSGVYRWTFAPSSSDADTPRTWTVESGSNVRANRFSYGLLTSLNLGYSREKIDLGGDLIGQKFLDNKVKWVTMSGATGGTFTITVGAATTAGLAYNATNSTIQTALEGLAGVGAGNVTVSGGPVNTAPIMIVFGGTLATSEVGAVSVSGASLTGTTPTVSASGLEPSATSGSLVPVLPSQTNIYVADAQSGLAGASALTRVLSVEWGVSDRFGPIWPLNSSYASWAAHVETVPGLEMKIKVAVDAEGMTFMNYLRTGSTRFVRVKSTGPIISGANAYDLQIDTALKINDVSEYSDEDGLYAVEFSGVGAHDGTWNKAVQVDLVNNLATL